MTKGATLQLLDNLGVLRIVRPTPETRLVHGTSVLRLWLLLQPCLDCSQAFGIWLTSVSIQHGVESYSLTAFGTD